MLAGRLVGVGSSHSDVFGVVRRVKNNWYQSFLDNKIGSKSQALQYPLLQCPAPTTPAKTGGGGGGRGPPGSVPPPPPSD